MDGFSSREGIIVIARRINLTCSIRLFYARDDSTAASLSIFRTRADAKRLKTNFRSALMSETQTSQPWDTLPSIWDGWAHQACGHYIVVDPQNIHHTCATGYMIETGRARLLKHPLSPGIIALQWFDPEARRRFEAVDNWLQAHQLFDIIHTNDQTRWAPDQFRDLDRRLEYEYQQRQIAKQSDAIPTTEGVLV